MSKRATAQSAASSLAHIYKPDPVAAHCVKPPRLAEPRPWQELKEWVYEGRSMKELQARSKPASNNEQQIAMGTRSFLLLPRWTNSGFAVGFKAWQNICDFTLAHLHILHFYFSNFNNRCFVIIHMALQYV